MTIREFVGEAIIAVGLVIMKFGAWIAGGLIGFEIRELPDDYSD